MGCRPAAYRDVEGHGARHREYKEDSMATPQAAPTREQLDAFLKKLLAFHATLGEEDQKLLASMYVAARGKHEAHPDEVQSYWLGVGPNGLEIGPSGIAGSPWGAAYNAAIRL